MSLRVGLIGRGSIGGAIAAELASGRVAGVELVGVLRRDPIESIEVATLDELLECGCDVVVEAAGHEAVHQYGLEILTRGIELVVLSAGALADRDLEQSLTSQHRGRLLISTGAIGGLDMARAFAESGTLEEVKISSVTTLSAVADVLDSDQLRRVTESNETTTVATGSAREIALMFPRTSNVAATVALATLGLDQVEVEVRIDPLGKQKRHEFSLKAGPSSMTFAVANELAVGNPRTSAITPYSVVRLLRDRVSTFIPGT